MRKGFTIIELLVASLLLGILVTILTMIFNQSSISWRVGIAGTAEMRAIRENIAEIREESDNAFIHGDKLYRLTGLWGRDGNLLERTCDVTGMRDREENKAVALGGNSRSGNGNWIGSLANLRLKDLKAASVGSASAGGVKTYTVNVMSGGPNNDIEDWEAIWSFPYEFDE